MPVAARSSVLVRLYTRSHVKLMSLWLDATVVEKFRVCVRCCISLVCSIRRFKSRIFLQQHDIFPVDIHHLRLYAALFAENRLHICSKHFVLSSNEQETPSRLHRNSRSVRSNTACVQHGGVSARNTIKGSFYAITLAA